MLSRGNEIDVFMKALKSRGLILDTCIAILYIVGIFNREFISDHEKLKGAYTKKDYQLLCRIASRAKSKFFITTPYIITELEYNLRIYTSRSGVDPKKEKMFLAYISYLEAAEKVYDSAEKLFRGFPKSIKMHGIADVSILSIAKREGYAVLTDDKELHKSLTEEKVNAMLFKNIGKKSIINQSKTLSEFGIDANSLQIYS